ncbi:helix-turn-helix transcriptional regulator [Roseateles amylovorans]|uniref:Helix-turn-helix domain-containing protein n=1 Tax=Roseateles amylovorans TaxID=2978473 RepID=A0ABY6AW13_9BURK|nr:helix-turn-helix transcriptional regulator [Roseateles amylovorans]UXH77187.1 helix-turn-helix domain-containing protein [Roseateles amylovorans]
MDKRIRHVDRDRDRELRDEMYRKVAKGEVTIGEAVKLMRKSSRLTQPEFAKHRAIERDVGNPTIETLNKVVKIFGLQVGFVPRPRPPDLT